MSHTDKAFIKAYRSSTTPAPRAARTTSAPSTPESAPAADANASAIAAPAPVESRPALAAFLEPAPVVAPLERPRPTLARDEEAFLATGVAPEPESPAVEPPRLALARIEDPPVAPEPEAIPEPTVEPAAPPRREVVAAPEPRPAEPRAYVEPDPLEEESPDAPRGGDSATPAFATRGVHSLADLTQASTAVTDWGPAATVERFELPEVCESLLDVAGDEFAALADEIAARAPHGEKLYLAASCQGNEGATTVVLCLARTLAARGLRTVVVDQDVTHPGVAEALHLQPTTGWAEVLSGEAALAEALVESEEEPLAILPLCTTDQPPAIAPAARQRLCLGLLKQHFDVVLLDAGPLHLTPHDQLAQPLLDAAIIVYDPQSSADAALDDAVARLKEAGLPLAAVAENFYVDVA